MKILLAIVAILCFLGCAGGQIIKPGLITSDLGSLDSVLKLTKDFSPDSNGFRVLGIPSKTFPDASFIIFKDDSGKKGFGITDPIAGTIFVMFSKKENSWMVFNNGMVQKISDEDAEATWCEYVKDIREDGDFSKAGRYKEPRKNIVGRAKPNQALTGAIVR